MKKELTFYSVLLAIALGLAFYATMPRQNAESEEFNVVNLEPESIAKIEYAKAKQQVVIEADQGGKGFWITLTEQQSSETANADQTQQSTSAAAVKTTRFKANREIKEYFNLFKPLQGQRNLGELSDASRKEYGLDQPVTLKLTMVDGKTFELQIGSKNVGGASYFAYVPEKKLLTLVDSEVNNVIEKSRDRLFERGVLSEILAEYDQALLVAGEKKKLIKKIRNEKNNTFSWLDEKQAKEAGSLSYEAWLENLERLRVEDYADDALRGQLDQQKPVFEVTLAKSGKEDHVVVVKLTDQGAMSPSKGSAANGATDDKGGEESYWIKSSYTSAYGRVSKTKMAALIADFAKLAKD